MAEEPPSRGADGEPPDAPDPGTSPPEEGGQPPASRVRPPPEEERAPLGLDDAWQRLPAGGRGVVVVLAAVLVVGAGIGIGLLAGRGDDGGQDVVVLVETPGSVVTVEGSPETGEEPAPEETETEVVPVPEPEETMTEPLPALPEGELPATPEGELPATPEGELPATPEGAQVFTAGSSGPGIGTVTVSRPSNLDWTGGGVSLTLVDRASGATLVDSSDPGGRVALEPGEYDLEVVEGGSDWVVVITDRG